MIWIPPGHSGIQSPETVQPQEMHTIIAHYGEENGEIYRASQTTVCSDSMMPSDYQYNPLIIIVDS